MKALSAPPEYPPPESLEQVQEEDMDSADCSEVDSGENSHTDAETDAISPGGLGARQHGRLPVFRMSGVLIGCKSYQSPGTVYIDCVLPPRVFVHCQAFYIAWCISWFDPSACSLDSWFIPVPKRHRSSIGHCLPVPVWHYCLPQFGTSAYLVYF